MDGNNISGVTVHTMIALTSEASMPRLASATRAASTAISDVAISGRRDVAFGDADAVHDPFIGRLDHLLQVGIRQDAGRHMDAERGYFCSRQTNSPLDARNSSRGIIQHSALVRCPGQIVNGIPR